MLASCSACGHQIAEDAIVCPGCGHAPAAARRGRLTNLWLLLGLAVISALHSAFSVTGDDAYDIGAFLGSILGSILFAALIYFVVWLVRGRKRKSNADRFILKTALVIAMLSTVGAALGKLQHPAPASPVSAGSHP